MVYSRTPNRKVTLNVRVQKKKLRRKKCEASLSAIYSRSVDVLVVWYVGGYVIL